MQKNSFKNVKFYNTENERKNMGKIDLDKFICSLAKQYKEMPKVWKNALSEQGFEYNYTTNTLHPIMPYTGDVSPLYKIGDYVVSIDDYVYKVIDVYNTIDKITNETKTKYKLSDINSSAFEDKLVNVEDFDKASHLWSIDDAMYGETVYLKADNDAYWLVMVDSVIDGNLYVLHSYSFFTKEHYSGKTDNKIWGPVSLIQQVCPASVSQRRVLLDIIKKSESGTYQSVVTNFNSSEKEISEPIISYHGEENTWNSATDFTPTDKQRCLCYDKSLNGIYCYTYVKETNAWYYQSDPKREDLTFLCSYNCNRVPFWMIMPEIPSFIPKSDCENHTDDVTLTPHKFSIGEWITNGKRILRIGCICEKEPLYYFDEKNFGSSYDTIEHVDANYHLWSIDDAKKDDILSYSGRDKIIIKFESKEDSPLLTIVKSNAHALFAMYDENVKVNSSTEKKAWPYYSDNPLSYKCSFWKPATSEEKKTLENILSSISQVAKKETTANNGESE